MSCDSRSSRGLAVHGNNYLVQRCHNTDTHASNKFFASLSKELLQCSLFLLKPWPNTASTLSYPPLCLS
eukprot:1833797-Amphidinium_carterae.1